MSTQPVSKLKPASPAREISQARIAANKANSLKSTGPRTPEGKARVSANALKHRLCSKRNPLDFAVDAALPHEQTQFLETLNALKFDLAPVGSLETLLLERLAQLDLRLQRALRMETAHLDVNATILVNELTAAGSTIATDTGAIRDNGLSMMAFLRDPNALTLIGRYESRLSREFARTLTQFHQAQKLRRTAYASDQTKNPADALCAPNKMTKQTQSSDAATISTRSVASDGHIANSSEIFAEQTHDVATPMESNGSREPVPSGSHVARTSVCFEASASCRPIASNFAKQTQPRAMPLAS